MPNRRLSDGERKSLHTGSGNHAQGEIEPLVVKPREAWRLLGCSNTHGYELLNAGELESFRDGRSRKIVVKSIHDYIARRLASAATQNASNPTEGATAARLAKRSRRGFEQAGEPLGPDATSNGSAFDPRPRGVSTSVSAVTAASVSSPIADSSRGPKNSGP
jgi:excisionase family DNA binding protein